MNWFRSAAGYAHMLGRLASVAPSCRAATEFHVKQTGPPVPRWGYGADSHQLFAITARRFT